MKKWTKNEIRACCAQLDTAWLSRRPGMTLSEEASQAKRFTEVMLSTGARAEVVLSGLRQMRELHARRLREYCESIGNQLVRFTEYGKPDELIVRFTRLARDADKDRAAYEALVLRVHHEGLPPEVLDYDPTLARKR